MSMFGRQPQHSVYGMPHRTPRWVMALLVVVVISMMLAGCGSDPNQPVAQQNKARLDSELRHARTTLGLPDAMLQPITSQEDKISSGEGGFNYNYEDAATNYTLLYNQLVGIEQNAQQTLQTQANDDIQALAKASRSFVARASARSNTTRRGSIRRCKISITRRWLAISPK